MESRDGFGALLGSAILSLLVLVLSQSQRAQGLPVWERTQIGQSLGVTCPPESRQA